MKRLSLSFVLPAAIVGLCLLVAGVMASFSLIGMRATLEDEAEKTLNVVLEQRLDELSKWFAQIDREMSEISASVQTRQALEKMAAAWRGLGTAAGEGIRALYVTQNTANGDRRDLLSDAGDGGPYSAAHAQVHPFFVAVRNQAGFADVHLIDPEGNVLYSITKEADFAENLRAGTLAQTGLAAAFRAAIEAAPGSIVFEDFAAYPVAGGVASAFFAAPVTGPSGRVIGVLAVEVTADPITAMMNNGAGLEETGRVVLVAADGTRRNAPRFAGGTPIEGKVPVTPQLEAALRGEDGALGDTLNDAGRPVVAAYDSLPVYGTVWGALAEQDRSEVLEPMKSMIRDLTIEIAVLAVIITGLGWQLGRWVSAPLRRLTQAMTGVAERRFADEIPAVRRRDEIGDIARSLDDFRTRLAEADKTALEVLYKSSAFSGSSVAMMVADTNGHILYHNTAAKDLFSTNRDELHRFWPDFDPGKMVGLQIARFHSNHDRIRGILSDPARLPFRSDVSIGALKFSINATEVRDAAGTYIGNVIEWADVREARLNSGILNAIRRNQSVVEIDLEGRVTEVNDVFCQIYGYERREIVGQPMDLLMPKGTEGFARVLATVRSGGHVNEKARRQGKGGREVWLESSINGIADQSGKVFKLIEIAADITEAQREMDDAQRLREAMEASQRSVVNALKSGLSGLASGDLSRELDQAFPGEYEELRDNFNSAVGQLRDVLGLVVETSANIRNGASEIAQAADDLSRRTESQAATLEETAAAMDELTESVKSASDGATEADRVVRDAREKAEASGLVVVDAVNAMSEIEKSSQQISQIIGVIDDIAFQTNLLALNAGVEAARAGEAGRGFAVVASEVRALAQRSSEAAKEIKQLISTSSRFVENGVGLVGQAGEALKTIVASVTEISSLVSEIAASSKEQANGLTEINSGVTMLDQVTQQNAAMVEQSTAASHSLRQEAEGLSELVARFRLGADPGAAVAAPRAPARPARKVAGGGWKAEPASGGDDGWESF